MSDQETQFTKPIQYDVRALLNGWFNIESGYGYGSGQFLQDNVVDTDESAMSVKLTDMFTQCVMPYKSPELLQMIEDVKKVQIGDYASEQARDYFRSFDWRIFEKIIYTEGVEFQNWRKYYDSELETDSRENRVIEASVAELPELPEHLFRPEVAVCLVNGRRLNVHGNNTSFNVALPVNPRELFNAVAIAQDTGALIEFTMPQNLSSFGTINASRILAKSPPAAMSL